MVCPYLSSRIENSIEFILANYKWQYLVPCTIVTKFLGQPGRGTGSRNGVEGHHFIKLWYEWGIPLWNDKLLCGTRP